MLAAWEWGQFSGFTSRSQRVWLAVLCGDHGPDAVLPCRNITMIFTNHWLPGPCGYRWLVDRRPCFGAFIRAPRRCGAIQKCCALYLVFLPSCLFSGAWLPCARHYDENHYSGAIWLLYVMILVWGLTLGPICLVNCSANINWLRRCRTGKTARIHRRPVYGSDYLRGYGVWANPGHCTVNTAGVFDFCRAGLGTR